VSDKVKAEMGKADMLKSANSETRKPICPKCGEQALVVFPNGKGCNRCRVVKITITKRGEDTASTVKKKRPVVWRELVLGRMVRVVVCPDCGTEKKTRALTNARCNVCNRTWALGPGNKKKCETGNLKREMVSRREACGAERKDFYGVA
jgi:ribosomal protein S27E